MTRSDCRFPAGGGFYTVLVVEEVRGSPEARDAALTKLKRFMTPASQPELEVWLAELSVIVARRIDDDATEALRLTAYTSRLSDYPADIAREALLRRPWRFWPSWAELEDVCKDLRRPRLSMIREIEAETWRAEQRAKELAQIEERRAAWEAERRQWEAEHAECMSSQGCVGCMCPDLCAI